MRVIWEQPPLVRQSRRDTCWAAVLESFCSVAPLRPKLKQFEIIEEFAHLCNSHLDQKIERDRLKLLLAERRFGLAVEEVSPEYFETTPEFLFQKLKSGYVILGYWEKATNGWHIVLVYGLDGTNVLFIDPDAAAGGQGVKDLKYFSARGNILVVSQKW